MTMMTTMTTAMMMKMRSDNDDVPKLVASIMVAIPGLTLKSGFAYLRLRRKAHQNSKTMMSSMIQEGIPEEYAKRLSEAYAADMSIRKLMKGLGVSRP